MTKDQMKVHGMSVNQTWATPTPIFRLLDDEFRFTLDPCCERETAKVSAKFYTKEDDGLSKDWSEDTVFMNPPYGRELPIWIRKAHRESTKGATVVCLIPARFDPKYWHDYCLPYGVIAVTEGRIRFEIDGKPCHDSSPPFGPAFVVFCPPEKRETAILKLTRFGKAYYRLMKKRVHVFQEP